MRLVMGLAAALAVAVSGGTVYAKMVMQTFPVLAGAGAHDVYPAADGTAWFTAQSAGKLGHRDLGLQIGSDCARARRGALRCHRWAWTVPLGSQKADRTQSPS